MQEPYSPSAPGADIGKTLSLGIGVILIAAGAFLAGSAFLDARALLKGPEPLTKWVALRAAIHTEPPGEAKKTSIFKIEGGVSMFGAKEVYALGGYLSIFFGILVLLIVAKIGLGFISAGARMVSAASGKRQKKKP